MGLDGSPGQSAARARPRGGGMRTGRFHNGIEYLAVGVGARTLLWLPGGPGSGLPPTLMRLALGRAWGTLVDAGFTVWMLTRRRGMPEGHTIADMADDVADVIANEFGGKVDVLVGESYGGLIAQYVAANHGDRVGRVVLSSSACRFDERFDDADRRLVEAICAGDRTRAGLALADSAIPGVPDGIVRFLVAPLLGRFITGYGTGKDPMVEFRAGLGFDSRAVLPRITVPVLLAAGDRDLIFPRAYVEETARLIPGCTLVWYQGRGHFRAASSRRLPHDIVTFANL